MIASTALMARTALPTPSIRVGNAPRSNPECHATPLDWLYGPLLAQPSERQDDEFRRLNDWTSLARGPTSARWGRSIG
jgi:hypothetical protein